MFTHIISRSYRDSSGTSIESLEPVSDNTELNFDGSLAIAANPGFEVDWSCTVANLQSIVISSDKAMDIYTNFNEADSGGSHQDHIALAAGVPLIWSRATDGVGKIPFAGNVTRLFCVNPAIATLKIRALAHQTS